MTRTTFVWWATALALVVVLVLTAMRVVRAMREYTRIKARVGAYADLPVLAEIKRGAAAIARIQAALVTGGVLIARARIALAIVRRGPIPPDIVAAAGRVLTELRSLWRFAREQRPLRR